MSASIFIDPRTLESLGSTRLRARAVVEGFLSGQHRNPHRGSSVEFAEYKEYSPGDDIRHIDWRAWGRIDRYYVKQFEDETNVRCWFVLDTSGSMDFAFEDAPTKRMWASTLVAAFAWLLVAQGDAPGLVTFAGDAKVALPPSSRRAQVEDICRALDAARAGGQTSIESAMARVAERTHARSIVVLVSDMLDASEEALTLARVLRRRGLEVVIFHVLDRAELELPWEGLSLFEGLEADGELLVDADDIRSAYQETLREHFARLEQRCGSGDIEYFRVTTDTPVEEAILQLTRKRQRGGGRAR